MVDLTALFHLDVTGAVALWAAGVLGVATWWGLGRRFDPSAYWLLAGAGMVYLGFDERLSLHERIGESLDDLIVTPPGVNELDDMVLAAYALAGVAVTLVCWREVGRSRVVWLPLVGACLMTAAAITSDALGPKKGRVPFIEERVEWVGQLMFLGAFARRWYEVRVPSGVPGATAAPSREGSPGAVIEDRPAG